MCKPYLDCDWAQMAYRCTDPTADPTDLVDYQGGQCACVVIWGGYMGGEMLDGDLCDVPGQIITASLNNAHGTELQIACLSLCQYMLNITPCP